MSESTTQLRHCAGLSIGTEPESSRLNKIICTIGPVSQSVESLKRLLLAGMNVVRLNRSHGSDDYHAQTIANARQAAKELGIVVAIALDTKGPEIRTGKVAGGGQLDFQAGKQVKVTTNPANPACDIENLWVDYPNIVNVVPVGGFIYVDDGLLSLKVLEKGSDFLQCEILNNATITDHKGCNLPNTDVDLPAVSEKDASDLRWGLAQGADMVFASFVRSAENVQEIKNVLGAEGKHIQIISKIENQQGVRNFDEILEACEGIMVARGDLGIEIPAEKVFLAQKMMISKCVIKGKPVICATQMLESMIGNPRPTRAEVSDVANAVLDGADCVMLSGETAKGKYYVEAVTVMSNICLEAQAATQAHKFYLGVRASQTPPLSIGEVICQSAVNAAYEVGAQAIIVLTNSGTTARSIAKYRPNCPVFCVTNNPSTARQMNISRACIPVLSEDASLGTHVQRIQIGVDYGKTAGALAPGDKIVAVHADQFGTGFPNLTRVLIVN